MSPRGAARNEEMRAASRERILAAALRLFAEHGYDATSMKRIAAEAGVAQGLAYHYFGGKDDLLRALFARSMDDVRRSFALAEEEPDPRARIARLVRKSVELLHENRDFWRLSYGARMQGSVVAALGGDLFGWTAEIVRVLEGYLRDARAPDPAAEARVLFALIDGVCQHALLDPDGYPVDAVLDAIVARHLPPSPDPPRTA